MPNMLSLGYSDKGSFDIGHSLCYYASVDLTESTEILLNDGANVNTHGGDYGSSLCAATKASGHCLM